MTYATKVAIPARLLGVMKANAPLIVQVTKEAYEFIHSRCGEDLQIGLLVASGLSALFEEFERGEHTKVEDFDQDALARQNDAVLTNSMRARLERIEEIAKTVGGGERIKQVAERIYNEKRAIDAMASDNPPPPEFWDERVFDKTRAEYFFAAAIALKAVKDEAGAA